MIFDEALVAKKATELQIFAYTQLLDICNTQEVLKEQDSTGDTTINKPSKNKCKINHLYLHQRIFKENFLYDNSVIISIF